MDLEATNIKKIYFKGYNSLFLLEDAIKNLKENGPTDCKITVIGKVSSFGLEKNIEFSKNQDYLKTYWSEVLAYPNNLGSFVNSETGNVFIVGTLASTFLREINGKSLGTIFSGPYAIIKGMGASENQAASFMKMLNAGYYITIFRGSENEMMYYEKVLQEI